MHVHTSSNLFLFWILAKDSSSNLLLLWAMFSWSFNCAFGSATWLLYRFFERKSSRILRLSSATDFPSVRLAAVSVDYELCSEFGLLFSLYTNRQTNNWFNLSQHGAVAQVSNGVWLYIYHLLLTLLNDTIILKLVKPGFKFNHFREKEFVFKPETKCWNGLNSWIAPLELFSNFVEISIVIPYSI